MKLIRRLLYCPKYAEPPRERKFEVTMTTSLLSIVLCALCMAGSTYAWFTASTDTPTQTIQSANYFIESAVLVSVPSATDGTPTAQGSQELTLELGTASGEISAGTYVLTVTAGGTGTGYLKIQAGDEYLYTAQIKGGETQIFDLTFEKAVTITACWGSYAGHQNPHYDARTTENADT